MRLEVPDGAKRYSDLSALAITSGVLLAMQIAPSPWWMGLPSQARADADSVQLSLDTTQPQIPPPPPSRPPPRHEIARSLASVPAVPEPLPHTDVPPPDNAVLVAADPPPAPMPAAAPSRANADLEAEYAAALRADIGRRTHSPEFARSRPRRIGGETQVRFAVTRSGEPRSVAVLRSSGSASLDSTALAVVASGHYPPMPDAIFTDESEHLFAVTIEFSDSAFHY